MLSLIYDRGGLTDGCAVAACSGDGVAMLELATGSGDSLVVGGVWRYVGGNAGADVAGRVLEE